MQQMQNPGLTPAQTAVAGLLAAGETVSSSAQRVHVDRSTIYRWLHRDPQFVTELNRLRQESREAVRAQLRELTSEAVGAVRDLLSSSDAPATRLRAALAVLGAVGALEAAPNLQTDDQENELLVTSNEQRQAEVRQVQGKWRDYLRRKGFGGN
jgi:hypothetical protein